MTEMLKRIMKAMDQYRASADNETDKWRVWLIDARLRLQEPVAGPFGMIEAARVCKEMNARSVLDCMREPTARMIDRGNELDGFGGTWPHGPAVIYQAMIDAAKE